MLISTPIKSLAAIPVPQSAAPVKADESNGAENLQLAVLVEAAARATVQAKKVFRDSFYRSENGRCSVNNQLVIHNKAYPV